ncbi:MAG: thermonuclease family protein [Clostridia bacterium]|nr:thermonuclease family protein [Clostridia bacterium]MBR6640695.1 thermonuclease family protein [Clostridia bacterium]
MKKKQKKLISGIITGVLALVLVVLDQAGYIDLEKYLDNNAVVTENNAYTNVGSLAEYEVVRVVDGDTIVVDFNGKDEKVRLIGVDTPESVHADESKNTKEGILVSDYTKSKLTGKKVKLEFDVQERDKYGRLLAYVYIDGEMYNKHLLEIGYAKIATYPPNVKYVEDFKEIQKEARENKVGLWNE